MIHTAVCPKFEITSANFRGTVEKSFGARQLKRLLSRAGLELVSLERHVCTASEWKAADVSLVHASLLEVLCFGLKTDLVAYSKCDGHCTETSVRRRFRFDETAVAAEAL